MNLLAWIIVGAAFYGGWSAHKSKNQVKAWFKKIFKKGYNSVNNL